MEELPTELIDAVEQTGGMVIVNDNILVLEYNEFFRGSWGECFGKFQQSELHGYGGDWERDLNLNG